MDQQAKYNNLNQKTFRKKHMSKSSDLAMDSRMTPKKELEKKNQVTWTSAIF